jgi:hypothetical protein
MILCSTTFDIASSFNVQHTSDLSSACSSQNMHRLSTQRLRSYSMVSEVSVDHADSTGSIPTGASAAAQLEVWGERLLASAVSGRVTGQDEDFTPTPMAQTSKLPLSSTYWSSPDLSSYSQSASSRAISPQFREKVHRGCDAGIATLFAEGLTPLRSTSSWASFGNLFGTGAGSWLGDERSLESKVRARSAIRGVVVVCGSLEEDRLVSFREELSSALASLLMSAAGPDLEVDVQGAQRTVSTCCDASPGLDGQAQVEFKFQIVPADPHDKAPALEVLRLEAQSGGARRLLPILAESPTVAGTLRLRLDLCGDDVSTWDAQASPFSSAAVPD